jgi:biopolymer transport protein ExbD
MQFKRQERSKLNVDITPLIDVVFLLLIFFMVSTTFTNKTELTIDLPQAKGQLQMQSKDPIEVLISESGEYSVNGQRLINDDFATLKSAISQVANHDLKKPFLITADANTSHQSVVKVMDAAGQLGLTNLSITTIKPNE